ncbi:nucleotidyltransferase domain-containing protein [Synechococcus sp. UW140]|uniref:nucleotidyltransferase domain-containing protein n=1 Tax=Synechococcus sp. UW140 TaxID=368503 RepID=UPI0025E13890|nr:nucleotidyltransferase domain-containing protein [Synechococcus sp. UW140]
MNNLPLQPTELEQVCLVLSRHPTVLNATIFGSRAKGTHSQRSDIDLALALDSITYEPLIKHIERVGIKIYFRKDQIYIKQLIASD